MSNPLALVVEDDKDLAVIFAKALESANFEVQSFSTAETAWDFIEKTTPSLIVCPHQKSWETHQLILL